MNINVLQSRSESKCELCGSTIDLGALAVFPHTVSDPETSVYACKNCSDQIGSFEDLDMHHWRCLSESMWSQAPSVQVVAWRILTQLSDEAWARDLLDMLYLEDSVLAWAREGQSTLEEEDTGSDIRHLDSNGTVLTAGDTVVLIKDLNVKGANFTAKRGTAVRGISLVRDNAKHIEGRVNGQQIVILTEFVKKS